jgi:integrase
VARLAPRLRAHLARWKRRDGDRGLVVTFNGQPISTSLKTALKRACTLAELEAGVTAYALRHTAATWLVNKGVPLWDVAAMLGTSVEMIERHYGHMAPDYGERAANAIGQK